MDPRSGFCAETKTFHSLRSAVQLPEECLPLSYTAYAFSLLASPLPSHPALVDSTTGFSISYPELVTRVNNLAYALHAHAAVSKGHVAFVLAPSCLQVPVLYLSLLSIGAVVSPGNPVSTPAEISQLVQITTPSVAFATSSTAEKLPAGLNVILLDSEPFQSLLTSPAPATWKAEEATEVRQSDVAAIQFSSGTTGRMKAAALPHRSFIAQAAGFHALRTPEQQRRADVTLLAAPMFHSLGFFFALKGLALGETMVVMTGRPGVGELLGAAERYRVTQMTAAPPVVVAMARSRDALRYDLAALERVLCGGAPLAEEAAVRFGARFPGVAITQGYGSTEAGGIARMIGYEECSRLRSVGRLSENIQAKIVDAETGRALSVGQQGELCLKSPAQMIGYIGDNEANASTFDHDGWLKIGDLCYIDQDGFLFIVDRLKELIKYKAYQVPPAELEQLLQSIPEIIDAAVIPYPNEEAGEIPMAFVVRRPGSKLSETQVIDFVAKQVAPYKKIRKVAFINSIPRSAAGKILRRELVSQARSGYASRL